MSKRAVAIHEAGHVAAILALPIRGHFQKCRLFSKGGNWFGETEVNTSNSDLEPKCLTACDVTKSFAGPMAELKFATENVPKKIREAVEQHGFLNGIWWLRTHAGSTEISWATDIKNWLVYKKHSLPEVQICYECEQIIHKWLLLRETEAAIACLSKTLLDHDELLPSDVTSLANFPAELKVCS